MFSKLQKITLISVVVGLVFVGGLGLFTSQAHAKVNGCSPGKGAVHQVTIKNNRVSPQFTEGILCDKIEITNLDNNTLEISFGPHEHHIAYDGVNEKFLNKNQSFTLTLSQLGMYHFHDHLNESIMGYFSVYKN